MTIVFACPCGKKLQAQDDHAGRRVRCPVCGSESIIPRAEAVLPAEGAAARALDDPHKTVTLSGSKTVALDDSPAAGDRPQRPRRRFEEDDENEDDRAYGTYGGSGRLAPPESTSKKAIASLVLGLLSFVLSVFAGLPAIVLGLLGMRDVNRSQGRLGGRGLAIAGLIMGIVGTLASLLILALVALVVPAVQKAQSAVRTAAVRMQDANNLKQIAIAMHGYHDANGKLPVRGAITGKDGKPLLSWRVALLPYLGEDALYKQFKLDEPWDSPTNKALLPQMPPVYVAPQDQVGPFQGLTHYRLFVGPGTPLEMRNGKPPSIAASMPDGTSNTLMVVEAADPIEWTRPDELSYDPKAPLPRLGGLNPGGFNVAFWDGSVRFISQSTPEATIRALITAEGGEQVQPP